MSRGMGSSRAGKTSAAGPGQAEGGRGREGRRILEKALDTRGGGAWGMPFKWFPPPPASFAAGGAPSSNPSGKFHHAIRDVSYSVDLICFCFWLSAVLAGDGAAGPLFIAGPPSKLISMVAPMLPLPPK